MAVDSDEIYVSINDPSLRVSDIQLSAEFATRMKNYRPAPALDKLRIDNATIVAAGDMLYVQSGYSMFGGMPGNVLIAYQLQKAEK